MSIFKHKKNLILSIALVFAIIFSIAGCSEKKKEKLTGEEKDYRQALELLDEGNYKEALITFRKIYTYKDSRDYVERFTVSYDKHTINNGENEIIYNFEFDKNGNCIKESSVQYLSGKLYEYSYDYVYDNEGNLIRKTQTDGLFEEDFYTQEYFYDNGKCVKETYKTQGSDYVKTTEYFYDNNGNITEAVVDGAVVKYYYDTEGNLIKKEYPAGGFDEYTYDSNGNVLVKVATNKNGRKEKMEYTYDEFGNEIELLFTAMDGIKSTYIKSYDEYGNLLRYIAKNASGDITSDAVHTYEGIRVYFR